jgi:hypothetical protein
MLPLVLSEQDFAGAPWWLVGVAVLLGLLFVAWERRAKRTHGHPLVNFGLLRTRSYAMGTALGLLYFAGFTSIFFVLTLFLQQGRQFTPLEAGLALTPFAVGSAVSSAVGGRLISRLGKPLIVGGLVTVVIGLVATDIVLRLDPASVGWAIALPLLVAGIGGGLVIAPNQTLALEEVPAREGGTAAGVLQTGQRIGSAIGISAVGAVFFSTLASSRGDWPSSISSGLVITVGLVVLALLVGIADLVLGRASRRRTPDSEPDGGSTEAPAAQENEETREASPDGGPAVVGRVVRSEDGRPVPGAVLTLVDEAGHQAARADGDADGSFRLVPRHSGSYQLVVRARGRAPDVGRVAVNGRESAYDVVLGPAAEDHVVRAVR